MKKELLDSSYLPLIAPSSFEYKSPVSGESSDESLIVTGPVTVPFGGGATCKTQSNKMRISLVIK